jgi:uncharacterized protein YqjF (DUF2071 family)
MKIADTSKPGPLPVQREAERERPSGPVVMHQRWENMLFVHWRWDPVQVQATLPPGLTVDTYHGGAWVGVTPLFMRNVRPKFVPPLAFMSDFLELNVRTYVYDAAGHPGVYFHSLDCDQPLVVETAQRLLHLRYEHAAMRGHVDPEGMAELASQRVGQAATDVFRYKATSQASDAEASTLEYFLLERYRLFSAGPGGQLWSVRVHHRSHRLRQAEAIVTDPLVLRLAGFDTKGRVPDHVCMADPVDVEVFAPEPVERA